MKSSTFAAGFALLALVLPCQAQELDPPAQPIPPAAPATPGGLLRPRQNLEVVNHDMLPPSPPAIVLQEPVLVGNPVTPPLYPRVWADLEYLSWWLRPNRIEVPLIATTRQQQDLATTITAGGIADPNTAILFGNQSIGTDQRSGYRLTFGAALNTEGTEAIEASGLWLPMHVEEFSVRSDAAGNPAITLPFNAVHPLPQVETSAVFAGLFNGAILHGSASVRNGSTLWGGEVNFVKGLYFTPVGEFGLIAGVRYLAFEDYLEIQAATDPQDGGGAIFDRFDARNMFYGGQLGVRHILDFENWRIQTNVKFALGNTNQELGIDGASSPPLFAAGSGLPGGLFTASSNIGTTDRNRLGFLQEVGVNVAYKMSDNIHLTVGYTFLYWDRVLRSGNQIDRNVNPALNPAFSVLTPPGGPAQPTRLQKESEFSVQGVNIGLRIEF